MRVPLLVAVSLSPAVLILHKDHFGCMIRLWKSWKLSPRCFLFPFSSVNLFPVCVGAAQRGERLWGVRDCWPGLGVALGYHSWTSFSAIEVGERAGQVSSC